MGLRGEVARDLGAPGTAHLPGLLRIADGTGERLSQRRRIARRDHEAVVPSSISSGRPPRSVPTTGTPAARTLPAPPAAGSRTSGTARRRPPAERTRSCRPVLGQPAVEPDAARRDPVGQLGQRGPSGPSPAMSSSPRRQQRGRLDQGVDALLGASRPANTSPRRPRLEHEGSTSTRCGSTRSRSG